MAAERWHSRAWQVKIRPSRSKTDDRIILSITVYDHPNMGFFFSSFHCAIEISASVASSRIRVALLTKINQSFFFIKCLNGEEGSPEVKKLTAIMNLFQEGKIRADYSWLPSPSTCQLSRFVFVFFKSSNLPTANKNSLDVCTFGLPTADNLFVHLTVATIDRLLWGFSRNASVFLSAVVAEG